METPEGPACGLIKAFALGIRITNIQRDMQPEIRRICVQLLAEYPVDTNKHKHYVFLNGDIIGDVGDAVGYSEAVRREGNADREVHAMVSVFISPSNDHVYIYSDEGRVLRPMARPELFTVEYLERSVDALIQQKLICYIDAAEAATVDMVMEAKELQTRNADYVEIHPALMLGVTASFIPFIACNQSPFFVLLG